MAFWSLPKIPISLPMSCFSPPASRSTSTYSTPLPTPWILSLPQRDLEVTVPSIGPDCPTCANTYLPNLVDDIPADQDNPQEMPRRLPCGHHLCKKRIRRLAWDADATDSLLCPFCQASHDHVPTSQGGSLEDILDKCMWIALEIFTWLHQDDFQDMDAVTRWAQDFPQLCSGVPEEDKRDAIRHAVECWLDMGDEEFSCQLAKRVYRKSSVESITPVARPVSCTDGYRDEKKERSR